MKRIGWVWGWVLLGAGVAAAQESAVPEPTQLPQTLTLKQALEMFRARGLDLLIAEAAVQSAEGDLRIAGAIPNPGLSVGYGKSFFFGPCDPSAGACPPPPALTAGLSDSAALESLLSGKVGLRKDVARAALEAARASRVDAERTIAFLVKQQFSQALLAQEALRFAREVAETNGKMLGLMETRNKAGAVSDADVLRVKVTKLEADQLVDSAAQSVRTANVALAFLLGVRSAVPAFEVAEPELLHYALPVSLAQSSRDSLLDEALRVRPDLLAQKAQVESAQSALSLTRRQRIPDIALAVNYAQQGTSQNAPSAITPPTVSVGLSTSLPVFYQQQGEVRKAEAALKTQELEEAKLEAQVVNDLETAFATFSGSRALVQRMEAGTLLDSAKRARDLVFIQYQKGAASLLDYLSAQQTFIATMVEYLTDLTNYWTAVFGLEKAVGKDLR